MDDSFPPKPEKSGSKQKKRLERLSARDGNRPQYSARYSSFVRFMRFVLPLAAMAVVAVLFTKTGSYREAILPVRQGETKSLPQRIVKNELLNPQFESLDKRSRPYKITADKAIHGEINKDLIMLENPIGILSTGSGKEVRIVSRTGAYRQDTERFFLEGQVHIILDGRYTLHSDEAHMDLRQNYAWSEKSVLGAGPDVRIGASGLQANGETGRIVFTGPAKLVLNNIKGM